MTYRFKRGRNPALAENADANGHIRSIPMMLLLGRQQSVGGYTYVPGDAEVFADRLELDLTVLPDGAGSDVSFSDSGELRHFTLPHEPGARTVSLEPHGAPLLWDLEDDAFRLLPSFDASKRADVNSWVTVVDGGRAIRVEREYAHLNLSEHCLDYACCEDDDAYYWLTLDYSAHPLLWELCGVFYPLMNSTADTIISVHVQDLMTYLPTYNAKYFAAVGIDADNFVDRYKAHLNRKLIEPPK